MSFFNNSLVVECSSYSSAVPPWDCLSIIEDIRYLASLRNVSFSHVRREANRVANWIEWSVLCQGPLFAVPDMSLQALKVLVESDCSRERKYRERTSLSLSS